MLVPPKQDDWSSRVDPTKLRNRKFNTGMGSKAPAARSRGESTVWTETPEQKRKRLEDEVMGVKRPAALGEMDEKPDRSAAEATETARRIQEYNVSTPCINLLSRNFPSLTTLFYRTKIATSHYTMNTRRPSPRRKKTIQVQDHLIEKRILEGDVRLITRKGKNY